MDSLLEAMLNLPDLPKQMGRQNEALADEHARRQQFYEIVTEEGKWEFINGEIIVRSPAKWRHIEVSDNPQFLLTSYVKPRGLGRVAHEKLMISLTRNDYEPDVCFFSREKASVFTPEQMNFPAPDFIAEVLSPSTARHDRRIKKRDCAAHGVGEYWIIDPETKAIEQYLLGASDYGLTGIWKNQDLVKSSAVEGFQIPAQALFSEEANLETMNALRQ